MKYSVCLLFTEDMSEVLLQRKLRSSYAGKLNGVGGKFDPATDRFLENCAVREVREETTADITDTITWLGTLAVPMDCASDDAIATVGFFSAIVDKSAVVQVEDEQLEWHKTEDILSCFAQDPNLAGDGNLQYFINMALIIGGKKL